MIINGKVYKSLGVIHVEQIKNWKKLKRVSDWVNAILTNPENQINLDHFAFRFETKNQNDLLNFKFSLLNESKLVQFDSTGKRNHSY